MSSCQLNDFAYTFLVAAPTTSREAETAQFLEHARGGPHQSHM